MTWTWAFMSRVLLTVNPSRTLLSSINFFQPQSCSFLQNLCNVSAQREIMTSSQRVKSMTHIRPQNSSHTEASLQWNIVQVICVLLFQNQSQVSQILNLNATKALNLVTRQNIFLCKTSKIFLEGLYTSICNAIDLWNMSPTLTQAFAWTIDPEFILTIFKSIHLIFLEEAQESSMKKTWKGKNLQICQTPGPQKTRSQIWSLRYKLGKV